MKTFHELNAITCGGFIRSKFIYSFLFDSQVIKNDELQLGMKKQLFHLDVEKDNKNELTHILWNVFYCAQLTQSLNKGQAANGDCTALRKLARVNKKTKLLPVTCSFYFIPNWANQTLKS